MAPVGAQDRERRSAPEAGRDAGMISSAARTRTEQKLKYAAIHIQELARYEKATSNDDWENAHHESCFFHLAGAVDALLHEINEGYCLGLRLPEVDWRRVAQRLGETGQSSDAFVLCTKEKKRKEHWLNLLYEWRNHGMHRRRIAKDVYASTVQKVDNQFKDPRTGSVPDMFRDMGCQQVLQDLARRVRGLVDSCRSIDQKLRLSEREERK